MLQCEKLLLYSRRKLDKLEMGLVVKIVLSTFIDYSHQVILGGSGADRIVGAIKPGVRYGDAAYAAMT